MKKRKIEWFKFDEKDINKCYTIVISGRGYGKSYQQQKYFKQIKENEK